MTEKILEKLSERYTLRELDAGDFASLRAAGMKFTVKAYFAEGLGQVSVMRAKGFFGLMRMDTLIINPSLRDLPLYSYDRIFAMGNDTLIVELYDTLAGDFDESALESAKSTSDVAERDPGAHWYDSIKLKSSISKKGKRDATPSLDGLTLAHLDAYLSSGDDADFDEAKKAEKAKFYVDGLLSRGGPSTDVFKKTLGEEKTKKLFYEVLFGIK